MGLRILARMQTLQELAGICHLAFPMHICTPNSTCRLLCRADSYGRHGFCWVRRTRCTLLEPSFHPFMSSFPQLFHDPPSTIP